ncbi:MAG: Calx-beta domain-containing protein, partial [Thermoguttaceae bacterium]
GVASTTIYLLNMGTKFVNITSPIEFRLYGFDAGSSSGQLRLLNNASVSPYGLFVEGTLQSVVQQEVTVGVSPTSVAEDGTTNLVYTFTRTGGTTGALTVNFNVGGTAAFGEDYTQSGASTFSGTVGTVTIADGSSTAMVTIDPTADSTVEPDETAILTIAAGTGYTVGSPSDATGTITNDDKGNITINDVSLAEGSPSGTTAFTFTVSLSNPVASNVTVDYATADGTATSADSDYTAASGTVTFTAGGALTQTVTVNVNKDSKVEADETFVVNLSNAKFGGATDATRAAITDSQGVGTITNDDVANITINDVTLAEGSPSGTTAFTFTVSLSNPVASNVTVDYATANGTATTADSDYTAASGTLMFTAGGALTQTVAVNVTKDNKAEADETFYVNLTNAKYGGVTDATRAAITDSQGVGTITNDDTQTWDGGGGGNNFWTTAANWVGDVAPMPGNSLVFPQLGTPGPHYVYNDFTNGTIFASITVSGSGYVFQGNVYQSSMVEVQSNINVEANAINTGTLTIGAGGVFTISALPSGPQSQETINDVDIVTNTSVDNIKTDPISLDTSSLDPVVASNSVVIDQPLPAEIIDQIPVPAPIVFDQPLPVEAIDTAPVPAPIALNLPLSATLVEILPGRESNSKIRDFLFSQPEHEVLFPSALTNSLSNDAPGVLPGSEHRKISNVSLVFDNVPGQKAFVPQAIFSITTARDTALQQTLHEDWRADWLWNDDLETIKKRQKASFFSAVP